MSLKGELTDLSLAELIEFFCNQRKTGRLTVSYPHAPAYFYLQSGSVVHASVGSLRGIEAVYYALTQSNASFNFSTAYEAPDQTINQPWTSVVLEGLRRMDEGIKPCNPLTEKIEAAEIPMRIETECSMVARSSGYLFCSVSVTTFPCNIPCNRGISCPLAETSSTESICPLRTRSAQSKLFTVGQTWRGIR